jgi:predicted type IV restriction endonuclease
MTDSHGEGRRREAIVAEKFRAEGWIVWQPPRTKFRAQDIFGVGDLLMFRDGEIVMLQICDKKSVARHRSALQAWNEKHGRSLQCLLFVWGESA